MRHSNWKQLSVIDGLSYWRFYFCPFNGSIKSPQMIIRDRLQAHSSKLVGARRDTARSDRPRVLVR